VDPLTWDIGIICTTADVGYALNDYISAKSLAYPTNYGIAMTPFSNASVIGFMRNNGGFAIWVNRKDTGAPAAITENSWRVMARAIR
jgi:hypothetical protein